MVDEEIGKKIECECEIVNDVESNKCARLQRSFGIDFGEPEFESHYF